MFEHRIQVLSSAKNIILENWINNTKIIEIFTKYKIESEYFGHTFAKEIINNYLGLAAGDSNSKACMMLDDMINFLKQKKMSAADFFIICANFRDSLISTSFELDIANKEFVERISKLFNQNFSDILNKYVQVLQEIEDELTRTNDVIEKHTFVSKTDLNGVITYASNAFCELCGYSQDELVGNTHTLVKHPDTTKETYESMWSAIRVGKIWEGEMKLLTKQGKTYWIDLIIEPIRDQSSQVIGYKAIRENITLQKEFLEQQKLIIEQSKSAAMGEMISMIAHQWRQPLQAVSILVQKLPITKMIEGDLSDEFIEQTVDDVSLQLDYMSKTIDDFRDFFKPGKGKDVVTIQRIIDKTKEFLGPILKNSSVTFTANGDDDIKILTHFNEVVQVFINIIKNAVDVMKERETKNRKLDIFYIKNESEVIIKICDNAGGIPFAVIDKIFDPYFSTKSNKNGTGLGLYMSKTIIEKHCNGTISAYNDNNGAVFEIRFPTNEIQMEK